MRICLYTDTALPKLGGQEFVVDALARQFIALGHEPIVFAPRPRKLAIRGLTYPYEVVRHPRFYSTERLVSWYRWFLLRLYRRRPFDVLHCHGIYPPSYLAALLGERLPVPVVITSHGGDVYEHNVKLQKPTLVERCVQGLQRADALVAISRFTRDGFTRLCPEAAQRIVDIPNGVHLSAFTGQAERPSDWDTAIEPGRYALFLGRLKHRKAVDVLLRALALTPPTPALPHKGGGRNAAAFPHEAGGSNAAALPHEAGGRNAAALPHEAGGRVQLVIAGDGEERQALETLCDQLGMRQRVRFVGAVGGAVKSYLLQNARFGVVPSRSWEAFGLVVLEGYASGLPMIATDMPGLADLIEPGATGLVVPPESPPALADAMTRLFGDDALVERMKARARQVVAQYDWRSIAQRHLTLYEKLIAPRRQMAA